MKDGELILIKRRWKQKEQILFLKRLGLLLEKGYSLNEAIDFIKIQLEQPKQFLLNESMEKLNKGENFYSVLEQLDFHPTAVNFTYYAEKNGQLASSLQIASEILLKKEERQEKLKKIITYPLFLFIVTGAMFFIIIYQLLPQFIHLYDSVSNQNLI